MALDEQAATINFRKIRQDLGQNILREGKDIFEKKMVQTAKVVELDAKNIKIHAKVQSPYASSYECDIEIDRAQSQIIDASCDCPHNFDCRHIAGVLFFLENDFEQLLVNFSKEKQSHKMESSAVDVKVKNVLLHAEKKVLAKQEKELEKHLVQEYLAATALLGRSSFFVPSEEIAKDMGELLFLFLPHDGAANRFVELQLILRLPFRSKPFFIQQPKQFFFAIQSQEPLLIGQNRYVFGIDSFGPFVEELLKLLRQYLHFVDFKAEKVAKAAFLDKEGFGEFLRLAKDESNKEKSKLDLRHHFNDEHSFSLPHIYWKSIEQPFRFYEINASMSFHIDLQSLPQPHIILTPKIILPDAGSVRPNRQLQLLECSRPGVFSEGSYYAFSEEIKRQHIHEFYEIQKVSIPEPLFGTFIENSLPELLRISCVENQEILDQLVTYPYSDEIKALCDLSYASGELEATLQFTYGNIQIPESGNQFSAMHVKSFIQKDGILARNLCEENMLVRELFHGFLRDEKNGSFVAKTEKKIVEFMTEVIPRNRHRVQFSCPETLLSQFIYDDTKIILSLKEGLAFDTISMDMSVTGSLVGIPCEYLFDCVASKKAYVVMTKGAEKQKTPKFIREQSEDEVLHLGQKIVVLKLCSWEKMLQVFDEVGIKKIENTTLELPLWTLMSMTQERFTALPVTVVLSERLQEILDQFLNMDRIVVPQISTMIRAELRHYQKDGVEWLFRLRYMGLNGILADDMGLGKSLQAICALTQCKEMHVKGNPKMSLIVCPTSLVDNWKEECSTFQPDLRVVTVAGTPQERKKLIAASADYDLLVTSYGLVQKDIELYEKMQFSYVILDEAQCIKNRETRNARSVKKIPSRHRLILTGTPLENSLSDLWSLFDFLMPGFLGTFERFSANYIRSTGQKLTEQLHHLKKRLAPFVLRRMKTDVLKDLPPISHIVYHCHLSDAQRDLYKSYAKSARDELTKLVEKDGFDKVRLHVLATLTRLKQICCHPAIFAKDQAIPGDSAKYEMFLDLVGSLMESRKKTVIFSQYTAMLSIMKQDLQKMGVSFAYLDGNTKNRLGIVKKFNEDKDTLVFLVSLKAGGSGLNLVGADTVIHYDMWWNPAVENQATDRVWRMGQKQAVSSYKLITLNTIEEKIASLQDKKRDLLKDMVRTDDDLIAKLSWEEVLELLRQ